MTSRDREGGSVTVTSREKTFLLSLESFHFAIPPADPDSQTGIRQPEAKFTFHKRQASRCWRRKENPTPNPYGSFLQSTRLLSTYCVPGDVPVTGNTAMNKNSPSP